MQRRGRGRPLLVLGVAEHTRFNGKRDLHEKREDEETRGPDTERDHQFQKVRHIHVDLSERVGNESGDDEPGSLFYPDPDDDEDASPG